MARKRPLMYLTEIVPSPEDQMNRIQRTLTAADLLALQTTPITLLPAPGAGKRYAPFALFAYYTFGTLPYTLNGATFILVYIGTTPLVYSPLVGTLDQVTNRISAGPIETTPQTAVGATNVPLQVTHNGPAQLTLGDGTLLLVLYYAIEAST